MVGIEKKIYVKNLNIEDELEVFYNKKVGAFGKMSSILNEQCLIFSDEEKIKILEIKKNLKIGKKGEFTVFKDLTFFTKVGENRVAVITFEKPLRLCILEAKLTSSKIEINRLDLTLVEGVKERQKFNMCIIADIKGEYLLVGQSYCKDVKENGFLHIFSFCDNVSIFKVLTNGKLELKSISDMRELELRKICVINFYGYFENEIIFCGKFEGVGGAFFVMSYDKVKNDFRIVKIFKEEMQGYDDFFRMNRIGDYIYAASKNLCVAKMKLI